MDELKSCPICGNDLVIYSMSEGHFPKCEQCGFLINHYFKTKEEAIIAANRRADGWIPVSERLPERVKELLFYDINGRIHKGYNAFGLRNEDYWLSNNVEYYKNEVTHWMPLPEPPKKGENDG